MEGNKAQNGSSTQKVLTSIKEDPLLISIAVMSVAFSVIFSILSTNRFEAMHATGYDLGLFSQAFYNTLHGKLFYTNLLGESYLTEHFSPIVFVYLVAYYVHSSPVTLLWIQGFVLGLAAVPLFLLSRLWLKIAVRKRAESENLSYLPFVLAISYLFSPMVSAPISFDFHIMTALPLFFFLAFYFFLKGNRILHAVFLVLIISLHSSFVIIVIFLLITEFLIFRNPRYYRREERIPIMSRPALKYLALFLLISAALLAYYYSMSYIKPVFSGLPPDPSGPSLRQAGALTDSPIGLLISLFTRPDVVFTYFSANLSAKVTFLFIGFAPTAFLSLFFPEFLVTVVPYLLYGMFSTFLPYYTVGYQYSMMLIPMVYVAVAGGISRIVLMRPKSNRRLKSTIRKRAPVITAVLIATGIMVGLNYTPFSPPSTFHNPGSVSNLWLEHQSESSRLVKKISQTISPSSYLVTQNDLFPFFSNDTNSYAAPWSPGLTDMSINEFQYLVAYYGSDWVYTSSPSAYSLVNEALASGQYGIYASGYGVLALEKNYTSRPLVFVSIQFSLHSQSLLPVIGNSSYDSNGYVTSSNITNHSKFLTTNNNLIFPGVYSVEIQYSSNGSTASGSFNLNISSRYSGTTLLNATVAESQYANATVNVTFGFSSKLVYNDIIFTGKNLDWNGNLTIQKIIVRQLQP